MEVWALNHFAKPLPKGQETHLGPCLEPVGGAAWLRGEINAKEETNLAPSPSRELENVLD